MATILQGLYALILMISMLILANLHFARRALMLLSHSNEKNHISRHFEKFTILITPIFNFYI